MSFQLKRGKPVARELSRIVAKEFETAIDELGRRQGEDRAEAVHEARKCVKKTRAVLGLLKQNLGDDYGLLAGRLRRVARQLSSLRDADAGPEMMNALRDHYPRIVTRSMSRAVQRGLLARTRATTARVDPDRLLPRVAREIKRSGTQVQRRIRRAAHASAIRTGIRRGYRRARKALACVRTHPENPPFHTWRRRVKDHWYHMRLLEGRSGRAQVRIRRLKQLETWLGDDHNLVMLRATILEAPARFGDERMTAVVLGCVAKYQTTLRRRALTSGRQLFASTPSAFRTQIDSWWRKGRARST
jgi:CHAD domain-containing protein